MTKDTHTTDRNGRLLETIWDLNERFNTGDGENDECLDMQFRAVAEYGREAAQAERAKIVSWLRSDPLDDEWACALQVAMAKRIEAGEHL